MASNDVKGEARFSAGAVKPLSDARPRKGDAPTRAAYLPAQAFAVFRLQNSLDHRLRSSIDRLTLQPSYLESAYKISSYIATTAS